MKIDPTRESIAVMIKGKYLSIGKTGRFYTVANLKGATLFSSIGKVPADRLTEKGKAFRLLHVKVHPILT